MAAKFGMRVGVMTLVSSLALLGSALAQSSSPSTGAPAGTPGAAPLGAPSVTQPRPLPNPLALEDVSKIKGAAVYDSDDNKIGTVSTVLMNPQNKTIDRFVVSEGGMLGVGAHNVALPISAFSWDAQKEGFTIAKTADDLKSMPEWNEQLGAMPDTAPRDTPRSGSMGLTPSSPPNPIVPAPDAGRT
jgi:hypothetical protein